MDMICKCGGKEFFTEKHGNQTGLYCSACGKWQKWLGKDEDVGVRKMKKRKFRAMTISEHCTYRKTGCNGCEYRQSLTYWDYYCDYSDFNQVNKWHDRNKPYKTKDGKYILIEVE